MLRYGDFIQKWKHSVRSNADNFLLRNTAGCAGEKTDMMRCVDSSLAACSLRNGNCDNRANCANCDCNIEHENTLAILITSTNVIAGSSRNFLLSTKFYNVYCMLYNFACNLNLLLSVARFIVNQFRCSVWIILCRLSICSAIISSLTSNEVKSTFDRRLFTLVIFRD